ncbi:Hypothetical predicted protein, partial [Paramuricea clavata]
MKVLFKILTLCIAISTQFKSESSSERQNYFKKIKERGDSLAPEEIISSHSVYTKVECSFKCNEEETCGGYNYRTKSKKHEINCQISKKSKASESGRNGEWTFYQDSQTVPPAKLGSLRLVSKTDSAFWYDRVTPYGDASNASDNMDMISAAFWKTKGHEIKITRSDDSSHTALLQTTSNCLQGGTFRSKIASYGNFRNGAVWASDQCLGSCPVTYGGQYETTAGFKQHNCSSNLQNSSYIGFWCDWNNGDGAVMMIGGGGRGCVRADHGIGITEKNAAKFGSGENYDFGNQAKELFFVN